MGKLGLCSENKCWFALLRRGVVIGEGMGRREKRLTGWAERVGSWVQKCMSGAMRGRAGEMVARQVSELEAVGCVGNAQARNRARE